jgi:hypothetical protein
MEAVAQALEMARDGDMVVIFADKVDEVVSEVKRACDAFKSVASEHPWHASLNPDQVSAELRLHAIAELAAQGLFFHDNDNSMPAVNAPATPARPQVKRKRSKQTRQGMNSQMGTPANVDGLDTPLA